MLNEALNPGENAAAIAGVATGATGFKMGFVIRLNCVGFGALVTDPLLVVAVLAPEVLLDAD